MSKSHDASAHAAMQAIMSPDPELNQTDRNIYAYLVYRANGTRLCWKRVDEIQSDLNIGTRQTVCSSTRKLKEKGLIEIRHRRRDSNHYRILDPGNRLYSPPSPNGATEWTDQDVKETAQLAPDVKETALLEDVKETALLEPVDVKQTAFLGVLDVKETAHESNNQGRKITKKRITKSARESPAVAPASRRLGCNVGFDEFWEKYPRKAAKIDARKAFIQQVKKGTEPAVIIEGLKKHRFTDDPEKIPYPATWLRRGQWTDVPITPKRNAYDRYLNPSGPSGADDDWDGPTINGEAYDAARTH